MKKIIGRILMAAGTVAVLAALSLFIYNLREAARADKNAQDVMDELADSIGADGDWSDGRDTVLIDGYEYIGYVSIQELGLDLPVMAEWSYDRLKISPCRYTGDPGEGGFVICAHNYSNHFGRLKELSEGDVIYFVEMDGEVWEYQVEAVETLEPTAVEEMTDEGYDLTLFTCTYGGQSRVTVRCMLAEQTEEG